VTLGSGTTQSFLAASQTATTGTAATPTASNPVTIAFSGTAVVNGNFAGANLPVRVVCSRRRGAAKR
jgi:hypothetical protein